MNEGDDDRFLWLMLNRLPLMYRVPLVLVHGHHETLEFVAEILGTSTKTLKLRLARGEGMLRDQLTSAIAESTKRLVRRERVVAKVMTSIHGPQPGKYASN